MPILITGTAGFIGFHVARRLLEQGKAIVGIDNLNNYYDVRLKKARMTQLVRLPGYTHIAEDIADRSKMEKAFEVHRPRHVIHLAAQAGVRYAAENPHIYTDSNVAGFLHILEGSRQHGVEHLVFASSSSVYGANTRMPYSEHQGANHPLSLYAATKKANEMMAHSYAHLFGIPCTGLRFFTVYGPWGRPDMALFKFTRAILNDEPIQIYNQGKHRRSFTYIDDIVDGVVDVLGKVPKADRAWNSDDPDPASSGVAPYRLYNIGRRQSVNLLQYVELLESALGKKAIREMLPMQPGDVPATEADVDDLKDLVGYAPKVSVEEGISRFVAWYRDYYNL